MSDTNYWGFDLDEEANISGNDVAKKFQPIMAYLMNQLQLNIAGDQKQDTVDLIISTVAAVMYIFMIGFFYLV